LTLGFDAVRFQTWPRAATGFHGGYRTGLPPTDEDELVSDQVSSINMRKRWTAAGMLIAEQQLRRDCRPVTV
jgi:hypothetical protein